MNLIKYKITKFSKRSVYSVLESNIPSYHDNEYWNKFDYTTVVGGSGYDTSFYINKNLELVHKREHSIISGSIGYHRVYIFGSKDLNLFELDQRSNSLCIGLHNDKDKDIDYPIDNLMVESLNKILSNFFEKLKQYNNDNITNIRD